MLDLLIVLAFIAYSVTVGLRARRRASQNLTEYFLAGRSVRGWQAGTSMAATQFAADTPLLVTGLIATGGIFLLWRLWIYGLAFLLLGFLFAAHWRRAGVLTDAELAESRYSGPGVLALRVIKALYYGTFFNCIVVAWVLIAAVRVAEVFLPWHDWLPAALFAPFHWFAQSTGFVIASGAAGLDPAVATANNLLSILALLAFISVYSMTGGLRGVVLTDVGQFALMLIGTIAFAAVVLSHVGGPQGMVMSLQEHYGPADADRVLSFAPPRPDPGAGARAADALLPFLLLISMQWLFQLNSDGTGYLAQRSMACRTDLDARRAAVTFAWLQIVLRSVPWLVIGVGLLAVYPFTPEDAAAPGFAAAREMTFVQGMNDLLPVGLRGIMLAAMLAALASTIDTHMNWGAGYWSNDIYKRLICGAWLKRDPAPRELVVVARLSNLLILAIGLIVMVNLGSIQDAWRLSLLFGAGVGPVLVMRWLWERINQWSEIGAMLVSLLAGFLALRWLPGDDLEWARLALVALAGAGAAVAAAYLIPATGAATLESFYRTVRPAGFWGRTAAAVGDTPARPRGVLRRELLTTAAAAGSLFLALYGLGRLFVPHPDYSSWIRPVAALVGSALLAPIWWRALFREGADEPTPPPPPPDPTPPLTPV